MLFKLFKETGRSLFTIAASIGTGIVFSATYLIANGFKCLTNNLSANVSVNVSQLNYTAILQAIESHSGQINIPIDFQISDTNIGACASPLIAGAAIGLGASVLYLTSHYAQQCAKRKEKQRSINNEESPLLREREHSTCCYT